MRCLVTGHRGFIGSALFERLMKEGFEVDGLDLLEGQDIAFCLPDKKYDYVFHLAGMPNVQKSIDFPSYFLRQNVYITSKILEWSARNKVKRFIFSSSSAVYGEAGNITSPYALHKKMSELECELYSRIFSLDTVCLRYFNVYSEKQNYKGSYSSVITSWMNRLRENKPLEITSDGTQTRDFIHLNDIIEANIFCMKYENSFNGKCFDVGTGNSISLNQLKSEIQKNINCEWSYSQQRVGDIKHSTISDDNNLQILGWKPNISLEEGIKKCLLLLGEINDN